MDDLAVQEKSNFWHNPFKCKTNLFTLDDLHGSRLEFFFYQIKMDDFHVIHL